MMKVTIVGLIYNSTDYLDFMLQGLEEYCLGSKQYDVDYLIVADGAVDAVLQKLRTDAVKYVVYREPKPNDYHMNKIYRAYNFGGKEAPGEIIIFVNSDMAFSPGWLENNLKHLNPSTIPCSRLVESGKLRSGQYGISKDFGKKPAEFQKENFLKYVKTIEVNEVRPGGLFMPCAFYKDDFINSGGYPEGNIYEGGVGAFGTEFLQSGDNYFFYQNPVMKKKKHITIFNSIVYHIQRGEMAV